MMRGYTTDYVNLIAGELRDHYENGFPILKELVQNADDAKARTLIFGLHEGFRDASHPLLKGPSLWFFNDGAFKEKDARDLRSFGINSKAGDADVIGKFGLGMKSVFHLCEALFYVAWDGAQLRREGLTPWKQGPDSPSPHPEWDGTDDADWDRLTDHGKGLAAERNCQTWFLLWLPLRMKEHLRTDSGRESAPIIDRFPGDDPARGLTFLTDRSLAHAVAETLPLLRCLERVEHRGKENPFVLTLEGGARLLGDPPSEVADGRVVQDGQPLLAFSARWSRSPDTDGRFAAMKDREEWPRVGHAAANGSAAVGAPDDQATLDEVAEAEEALPGTAAIVLMKDEIERLDDLVALTDAVVAETKIERLVALVRDELPPAEPVLLFTEYKTTQALVVNALHRQFGFGSATFINGDDRLDGLEQAAGGPRTVNQPREQAAEAFNAGRARFLVSTEAGGEGIDLQERCAVLVHVDMPWNPMRLHQRVGRLSRYGQSRPVTAYILRNPDTVEARIWDLLNEKLERVQQALSAVMEQQEDISQLVIGMAGPALFNELYSSAQGMSGERLTAWFDEATATLGGRDVVETVRELLGSVSHFDFQQVGRDLPQVDVPDLERFFTLAVGRHKRRVFKHPDGLEIKAPEAWKSRSYAVRDRYDGLVFDRGLRGANAASRVLGVGHTLFDIALEEARDLPARVAALDGLPAPVLVLSIEDEVTGTGSLVHRLIFGVMEVDGQPKPMRDWELLTLLNGATLKGGGSEPGRCGTAAAQAATADRLKNAFESGLADHAPSLRRPVCWPEMLFVPGSTASPRVRNAHENGPAGAG